MGKPKKQTTDRRTGNRRSHFVQKLAKVVNDRSPVHVRTTAKQSSKKIQKFIKTNYPPWAVRVKFNKVRKQDYGIQSPPRASLLCKLCMNKSFGSNVTTKNFRPGRGFGSAILRATARRSKTKILSLN